MPSLQTNICISNLRITVTGADVNYVGSVTIDAVLCDHLGIFDRQLLQIRNERTGVDLWTYVIYGRRSSGVEAGTLCLNGAAAHLVNIGDVVNLLAWADYPLGGTMPVPRVWDAVTHGFDPIGHPGNEWAELASVQIAIGKVHRPRLTDVIQTPGYIIPSLALDEEWAEEAGLLVGQCTHLVNITTGQRDTFPIAYAPRGSKECVLTVPAAGVHNGLASRAGHGKGDIVIAMSYGTILRRDLVVGRNIPAMKIAFPFEKAVVTADKKTTSNFKTIEKMNSCVETSWALEQHEYLDWLIQLLDLKRPGLKVLDCSGGTFNLCEAGVDITVPTVSPDAAHTLTFLDVLSRQYGPHAFDVVVSRIYPDTEISPIHESFQGIYEVLKPGGRLYLDIHYVSAVEIVTEQGPAQTMTASLNAQLVREQEIRSILSNVGFGAFETLKKNPTAYQPFLAHKPKQDVDSAEEKKVDHL